jgi:hypothetical protein
MPPSLGPWSHGLVSGLAALNPGNVGVESGHQTLRRRGPARIVTAIVPALVQLPAGPLS